MGLQSSSLPESTKAHLYQSWFMKTEAERKFVSTASSAQHLLNMIYGFSEMELPWDELPEEVTQCLLELLRKNIDKVELAVSYVSNFPYSVDSFRL
jgi:methionyl-tRNA formyltransferase